MKRGDLVALLLVIELSGCTIVMPPQTTSTPASPDPATSVAADLQLVAKLINEHRKEIGCPVLLWNETVAKVAQAHSDDMVRRNFFSHDNPEGLNAGKRLDRAEVRWVRVAENIAAGQRTPREVYNSWMNSPGHRANIENCALREHGLGLTRGTASLPYGTIMYAWTHDFVTIRQ